MRASLTSKHQSLPRPYHQASVKSKIPGRELLTVAPLLAVVL